MAEREIIDACKKYIQSVAHEYNLQKAYMFGSHAKGTNRIDSDIDIAIIIKDMHNPFDMQLSLMKLRRNLDLRIEPHPFDEQDFNSNNPFASEIVRTGIEIKA